VLLIMSLMLLLSLASIAMLSALRAYVNGESLWSKAERQAVADLQKYGASNDESYFRDFESELQVPLGDRAARLELQSANPDIPAARRGLLAGRNHPDDIDGMITLFRLFHSHPLMDVAIRLWTAGDARILELERLGNELHRQIRAGHSAPQTTAASLETAERVHRQVAPLEEGFSRALGGISRRVTDLLFVFLTMCSLALVAAGMVISRASLRRNEKLANELAARLQHQATHDALTGLHNRLEFESRLSGAIQEQRRSHSDYALLYLDLDQFKVINDTCGHAAGDELIRQVAWLIRDQLRRDDVLARLGGDEFGALLPLCSAAQALLLAEQIRQRIQDLRFKWQDKLFAVNASIGVLSLSAAVPTVSDALIAADQACYLAKDSGRNRVQLYRPDDRQVQLRRGEMRWVERINAALDEDMFVLVAQEIVPVGGRTARGPRAARRRFELLLRMVSRDGEWIAPMAFIPAAERYGLMPRVDRWVIDCACRELAALRAAGKDLPTCMINLSGASVSDAGLADYISQCLSANSLRGEYVGFELTETAAIGNLASASALMNRLRQLGCPIALDDFGSGMSSFSYLKTLPIDFLKIDGAFVRHVSNDPVDFAVVEAIQRVGQVMGIHTIAECVEDAGALSALALIGVDFAQGLYLCEPVRLTQIEEPLARRASAANLRAWGP
jgi:diguanylate cyclase (GGDEF)-like protein